jgi:hypothetical protein
MLTWRHGRGDIKDGDMETWRHRNMEKWRHGDMDMGIWKLGLGDMETWRHDHMET